MVKAIDLIVEFDDEVMDMLLDWASDVCNEWETIYDLDLFDLRIFANDYNVLELDEKLLQLGH